MIDERILKGLSCCAYRDESSDPVLNYPISCKRYCPFYFPEHPMDYTQRLARAVLEYLGVEPPIVGQAFNPD